MTAYRITSLPARELTQMTIICPGCAAKTITDLHARSPKTSVIGPCCGSCGLEFDGHVAKVMENFMELVQEIERSDKFKFEFPPIEENR